MGAHANDLTVHWNAMVRSARNVLGSRAEAEDCAGQAILQVCEQDIGEVQNLEAYMVTVTKRRAIDRLRHLERCRSRDQLLAGRQRLLEDDHADDVARRSEARWIAEQAQRLLDPRSLDVLVRYADGEPMASIAAAHQLREGAARTVLYRARTLLKEVYAKGLALVGMAWVVTRRAAPSSAVPVATTLAALVFTLLPHPTTPDGQGSMPSPLASLPDAHTSPLLATPADVRVSPPPLPVQTQPGPPIRRPTATDTGPTLVRGPAGSGVKFERQHRGDDGTDTPIVIVLGCASNLKVGMTHIGC